MRKAVLLLMTALYTGSDASAQVAPRAPTPTEIRLYARLLAMTDSRTFDRSLIDSVLLSQWAPLRAAGALAVGQVGSPRAAAGAPVLRVLLRDGDATVASNAAYALGLLRDSAGIPALAEALNGRQRVAREAAWALGEIGTPAKPAIARGLATPGTDEARMIQLLLAAAKLRPVPVADLRPYLAMANRPAVLWAASYAVARTRAPAGVRDLITLGTNPEFVRLSRDEARGGVGAPPVVAPAAPTAEAYVLPAAGRQRTRTEIARALARQAAGDSLADAAIAVLLRLVGDPHPHVRINAVRSLATYGVRGRDAVVAAARDPDANVRIATAQSLGTVLDSATSAWLPLWQHDTTLMYRASLLASAARAGAALPALAEWTRHRDWHYRAAALNAAGSATDQAAVARAATAMLRDTDGRVRAVAYGLLGGNDTTAVPQPVRNALLAGLTDRDFYVRATILGNLARHPRAAELPAVLSAYERSLADSGNDARIAAMQYVAAAWKHDSDAFTPAMRNRLTALRPPDDPLVRAPAESVGFLSSWRSLSGIPRAPAFYEDVVQSVIMPALRGQTQRATIRTARGDISLELFGADAPITVRNFLNLASTGYYRGTRFHRVVPNFVAQDGDPRDDGNGGPGYAIRDEMNPRRYERGAVGMALSGPDTGGSQYFITHSPQPHLDGHYTVFGRVLRGYPALDALIQGDRILAVETR